MQRIAHLVILGGALVLASPAAAQLDVFPEGDPFQANLYATSDQRDPGLISTGGSFIASWTSDGQDQDDAGAFLRPLDAEGAPIVGEFVVNGYTTGAQEEITLAFDPISGDALAVWTDGQEDGDGKGIFATFLDVGGVVGDFQVNTSATSDQDNPEVATIAAETFVVVWTDRYEESGEGTDIVGRVLQSTCLERGACDAGTADTGEFVVPGTTALDQDSAVVAAAGAGDFLVVWESAADEAGPAFEDVYGRFFDSSGVAIGGEFLVNGYTTGPQVNPALSFATDGSFVVAWEGVGGGIDAQRFDSTGAPQGGEFAVADAGGAENVDVAHVSDGRTLFVWNDGAGTIQLAGIDAAGLALDLPLEIAAGPASRPELAVLAQTGVVIWQDEGGQDGSGLGIFGQVLSLTGAIFGDGFDDGTLDAWSSSVGS